MQLELINVSFTYMKGTPFAQEALQEINLKLQKDEFLGIIGPTGSGKSTLIQHFNGLLSPTKGKVLFDSQDISSSSFNCRMLRQKVGLLFQFPEQQLFEETVFSDVAFGPRNLGLTETEINSRVKKAMEAVGLDYVNLKDRSPFSLSGGEMRRVAMAGVLAMEPEILVLDEPLAGLDFPGRKRVISHLKRLREAGLAIVLVTHDMEAIATLSERIVVLSQGKVVIDGSPQDVFTQGEKLKSIGLDLPPLTRIVNLLRSRGWEIPPYLFGVEETTDAILRWYRKEKW